MDPIAQALLDLKDLIQDKEITLDEWRKEL